MARHLKVFGLGVALAGTLAAGSGAGTVAVAGASAACLPGQLSAKMMVILGSAGAGNIEYRLLLKNTSIATCTVSGHPGLKLFGLGGRPLPTHVTPVPPAAIGVLVMLAPGASAAATLRFSPDVPGPGEQTTGPCEKTAHVVKVTLASPGSGTLQAPIKPPTAVCEHGSMTETNLAHV
jgi:hypothetical protein